MLINRLAASLHGAKPFAQIAEMLGRSEDATLATPGLVRPAVVASLYALEPRPMLVVLVGRGDRRAVLAPDRSAARPRARAAHARPHRPSLGRRRPGPRGRRRSRAGAVRARQGPPPDRRRLGPRAHAHRAAAGQSRLRPARARGRRRARSRRGRRSSSRAWPTSASSQPRPPGQFAVRGGILDVYPAGSTSPVRAELFGDEIETLRHYVPSTGQAIGDAGSVEVFPCRELAISARGVEAAEKALFDRSLKEPTIAHELELLREGVYFNGIERYLPLFYKRVGLATDYLGADTLVVVDRAPLDLRRRRPPPRGARGVSAAPPAAAEQAHARRALPHARRSSTSASASGSRSSRCTAPAPASTPSLLHAAPRSPAARSGSSAASVRSRRPATRSRLRCRTAAPGAASPTRSPMPASPSSSSATTSRTPTPRWPRPRSGPKR